MRRAPNLQVSGVHLQRRLKMPKRLVDLRVINQGSVLLILLLQQDDPAKEGQGLHTHTQRRRRHTIVAEACHSL